MMRAVIFSFSHKTLKDADLYRAFGDEFFCSPESLYVNFITKHRQGADDDWHLFCVC